MFRLLFLPARAGIGGTKLGYRTGRLLGYRRLFVFALGVGVGLLVAPMTGREARAKLQRLIDERRAGGTDLAERVRFELSHAPRTWHLPQPTVEMQGGTAILRGIVPDETSRLDLERTAAAVAGVVEVDNHLAITSGTNGRH